MILDSLVMRLGSRDPVDVAAGHDDTAVLKLMLQQPGAKDAIFWKDKGAS